MRCARPRGDAPPFRTSLASAEIPRHWGCCASGKCWQPGGTQQEQQVTVQERRERSRAAPGRKRKLSRGTRKGFVLKKGQYKGGKRLEPACWGRKTIHGIKLQTGDPNSVPSQEGQKSPDRTMPGTANHRARGFLWTHERKVCQG